MSTKTLPGGFNGNGSPIVIFLILSVIIHMGMALSFYAMRPLTEGFWARVVPKEKEPLAIDIVELPPGPAQNVLPKKPPTHYADRTQSVGKETYPEPSKGAALKTLRGLPKIQPFKPSPAPGLNAPARPKDAIANGAQSSAAASAANKQKAAAEAPGTGIAGGMLPEDTVSTGDKGGPSEKAGGKAAATAGSGATGGATAPSSNEESGSPGRPNLFLSDERIAELTRRYEAEAPKGEKGKTLQLNTSELRYQKYFINMKHRIEFYWEYPDPAVRNGWQGKLRIDFTIKKDGSVGEIKLVKSSNYPVLDSAAITAIRLAAPFPPFPENFSIEELNVRGQFEYDIYEPTAR